MNARVGQTIDAGWLTGIVKSVGVSGATIDFALVSSSGFTRTSVGHMAVQLTHGNARNVQMLLAIGPKYHDLEFLSRLRSAVFSACGISDDQTWSLKVSPDVNISIESKPSAGCVELVSSG